MKEISVRLLVAAGALMFLAGLIFAFLRQWPLVALLWAGSLGCGVAAINFKNQKDDK